MALERIRATPEERGRAFPGDGLLAEPIATWTHGVTISAPPRMVWPWVAQMGAGRAGWYSWDLVDNGGRPSAGEIVHDWEHLAVGDVMPAGPGVTDMFVVERLERGRDLVLGVPLAAGGLGASWEFLLDPLPDGGTRLLVRARVSARGWMAPRPGAGRAPGRVFRTLARMPRGPLLALARAGHRVMQARQLRGIRRRAEAHGPAVEGPAAPECAGLVKPGFEPVRDAFLENFERRGELGAACCVYHRGEKVVDLWGGVRRRATGEPWEADTMALVYSATKGMAGLAMALAHSRGLLDYDERVSAYWPEFAQQGKERITVRQLLSHQAGLFALDERPVASLVADPDRLAAVLARQRPRWPAGAFQAYHAITLGFYESELLRRVDPEHRTLGRFFQDELATPLGLDFYIRLPEEIPDARLAPLHRPRLAAVLLGMPLAVSLVVMNPRSRFRRALLGSELPEQTDRVYARGLEIAAGGGVGTARAMARAYGVFANGGAELGLREETLRQLAAPAVAPAHGFRDACMKVPIRFSLGFMKPGPETPFSHPSAYGSPGTGGSVGFADPHAKLGFGYIPNQMGTHLDDPRAAALRNATYRCIGEPDPYRG